MSRQWYGSLQNRLMERTATPKLEIGMGVTKCMWSDCHAYEIIAIKDDRHITVRRMGHKCLDYYAGDWEVWSDPTQTDIINLFKTKNNGWRERIGKNGLGDTRFAVGYAKEYEDPSF